MTRSRCKEKIPFFKINLAKKVRKNRYFKLRNKTKLIFIHNNLNYRQFSSLLVQSWSSLWKLSLSTSKRFETFCHWLLLQMPSLRPTVKFRYSITVPSTYISVHCSHKFAWSRIGILFTFRRIFTVTFAESSDAPLLGFRVLDIKRRSLTEPAEDSREVPRSLAPSPDSHLACSSRARYQTSVLFTLSFDQRQPICFLPSSREWSALKLPEESRTSKRDAFNSGCFTRRRGTNLPRLIRSPTKPIEFRFTRNPSPAASHPI